MILRKVIFSSRTVLEVGRRQHAARSSIRMQLFKSAPLQYRTTVSLAAGLLARLDRRLADEKEGLGYEAGSHALPAARAAFKESLGCTDGHYEHIAPETVATGLCRYYHQLAEREEERRAFFAVLAGDLGVEHDSIVTSAQNLVALHSQHRNEATLLKSGEHLRQVLRPFYCDLFSHIARLDGGIKFLVDFRGDLLREGLGDLVMCMTSGNQNLEDDIAALSDHTADHTAVHLLAEMNTHLKEILAQWFSVQLLDLQNVTWESPCDIMEKAIPTPTRSTADDQSWVKEHLRRKRRAISPLKCQKGDINISQYEAVHPLRHWKDLKHRVGPNRRCFIFTHRAIPREPIVVLHAALTSQASSSIQALLNRALLEDSDNIDTAVFYSISATQRGLSGVELGNFLIRRVVQALQHEFPDKLRHFVTLSPIPGFRRWLESHLKLHAQLSEAEHCQISEGELEEVSKLVPACSNYIHALQVALCSTEWVTEPHSPLALALRKPLTTLCARYLALETRRGRALDPVAHFHLLNGASIWRLNWLADTSPNGLKRSHGLMTNYRYHLPDISKNSDGYRMNQTIALSNDVRGFL